MSIYGMFLTIFLHERHYSSWCRVYVCIRAACVRKRVCMFLDVRAQYDIIHTCVCISQYGWVSVCLCVDSMTVVLVCKVHIIIHSAKTNFLTCVVVVVS